MASGRELPARGPLSQVQRGTSRNSPNAPSSLVESPQVTVPWKGDRTDFSSWTEPRETPYLKGEALLGV